MKTFCIAHHGTYRHIYLTLISVSYHNIKIIQVQSVGLLMWRLLVVDGFTQMIEGPLNREKNAWGPPKCIKYTFVEIRLRSWPYLMPNAVNISQLLRRKTLQFHTYIRVIICRRNAMIWTEPVLTPYYVARPQLFNPSMPAIINKLIICATNLR